MIMDFKTIFTIVGVLIFFMGVIVFLTLRMMKQSAKDWATLQDLEKRSLTLKTKEEIEVFHKEFVEKSSKIHNDLINPRLAALYGYLRGIYQPYTQI